MEDKYTTETDRLGIKRWYKNGLKHRDDGPAMEYDNGDKIWYKNGVRHRENGPAVEWRNGTKFWYKNGVKHREDGPAVEAVEYNKDVKKYYLEDEYYTEEEYYETLKEIDNLPIELQLTHEKEWVRERAKKNG